MLLITMGFLIVVLIYTNMQRKCWNGEVCAISTSAQNPGTKKAPWCIGRSDKPRASLHAPVFGLPCPVICAYHLRAGKYSKYNRKGVLP